MAVASLHVMQLPKGLYEQHTQPMQSQINVGSGSDVTIADLAHHIAQTVGYKGQIKFDASKPDGAPRKWMNSSRLNALGWSPQINLQQGLAAAYQDFVNHHA
jgi:GDP-L-fucose synthase